MKKLCNVIGAGITGAAFTLFAFRLQAEAFDIAMVLVMAIVALCLATAKHQESKRFASRRVWFYQ